MVAGGPINLKSAASNNATLLNGGPCTLLSVHVYNNSAAKSWLKFFDKATAPTPGTDVPVFKIGIAIGGSRDLEFGPRGIPFTLGLGYCQVVNAVDSDNTAVAVDDQNGTLTFRLNN